jgi:hypothetical protein
VIVFTLCYGKVYLATYVSTASQEDRPHWLRLCHDASDRTKGWINSR